MRSSLSHIVTILLVMTGLVSCSTEQTIRIGYLGTLNGLDSQVGVQGRNGCELAVEEINRSGGIDDKKIELISRDAGEGPDQALAAAMDLYRNGVVAIIAQTTSNPLVKVFDFINSNKILLITPTAGADSFKNGNDYFFRIVLPVDSESKTLASTAYHHLKLKRIAAVYDLDNLVYSKSFFSKFKSHYESLGGSVVFTEEFYSSSPESINTIVRKLMNSGNRAQGVLIIANSMQGALFCQLLAKEGSLMPILTSRWALNEYLIHNSGKTSDRIYLSAEFEIGNSNTNFLKFEESFFSRYNTEPEILNYTSYEAMIVLAQAMQKCVLITSESIRDALLEQRTFNGLQGPVEFNATGEADRTPFLLRITNGKFRRLDQ